MIPRPPRSELFPYTTLFRSHLFEDCGVIFRRGYHGDILVVLGGGAQHGGPADIDVLDQFGERCAGPGGDFLETVQVHHHHVDGHDAVRLDGRHVFGVGAHGENAAGDLGVHGLDAAIQHLGKSRDVADIGDGDAGVAQQPPGAARGDEFGAHGGEGGGEFEDAALIGDAEQYARDFCHLLARYHGPGRGIAKAGKLRPPREAWPHRIPAASPPVVPALFCESRRYASRIPSFFPTLRNTSSAVSSSAFVCVDATIVRTRAFPLATVGKPMPVASTPSLKSSRDSWCASAASPTITGVIGVSLIPVWNPADFRPALK